MQNLVYFFGQYDPRLTENICNVLEMPRTEDLGCYLGVPTIHKKVNRRTYQAMVERIDKHLAGWKSKCLSLAGRLTLF